MLVCVYVCIYIEGEAVKREETYKFLGVVFGSKLNWKENINSVPEKVNFRMYCLRTQIFWSQFRYVCNFLKILYNAVICSLVMLGSVCWGGDISTFDRGRVGKDGKKSRPGCGKATNQFSDTMKEDCTKK